MTRRSRLGTVVLATVVGCSVLVWGQASAPPAEPEGEGVWLGVWLTDLVDGGVQVVALSPGGPAKRAGLRSGDVIVEVNRSEVGNRVGLGQLLDRLKPGEILDLGVLRSGNVVRLPVRVEERRVAPRGVPAPTAVPSWRPAEAVGLTVSEITPALRRHYGAPEEHGVLVVRVAPDRLADRAGVQVGDVLVRAAGRPVVSESQVRGNLVAWSVQRPVRLEIVRGGKPLVLELPDDRLPPPPPLPARPAAKRRVELEIERLERRLEELRRELAALDDANDTDEPR